jgi:hypothetical protein
MMEMCALDGKVGERTEKKCWERRRRVFQGVWVTTRTVVGSCSLEHYIVGPTAS